MINYMQEMLYKMKIIQAENLLKKIKIYRLYLSAFPKCERKPFSMILKMQKKGKTDLWYAEKNGRFAGFGATINGKDIILLDYFAITKNMRGKGIGSEMLVALRNLYPEKGFFLEIEKVYTDAENFEETSRRKQFYLSNGMKEMGTDANLFGVDMELLGYDCRLTFDEYRDFYKVNYGEFAAKNIRHITSL